MLIKSEYNQGKQHFTTSCISYILLYFVFCHIICIFKILKFSTTSQMLNFIYIEVTWKLGYLRRLIFFREKSLRGHTLCLHAKGLIYFRMYWQTVSQKMWVMGTDGPQYHENKVSRSFAIFMINRAQHNCSSKIDNFWGSK